MKAIQFIIIFIIYYIYCNKARMTKKKVWEYLKYNIKADDIYKYMLQDVFRTNLLCIIVVYAVYSFSNCVHVCTVCCIY